jgi:hypothetical protein
MWFLCLFILLPIIAWSQQVPDAVFHESGAVRYDFALTGNKHQTSVFHQQSKFLPFWGGNPLYLVDTLDLGIYRYRVCSLPSGNTVFLKGFSPLFWEWQGTEEALHKSRSFSQALFFPRPVNDVVIHIETRKIDNSWELIFTDTLRVDDYFTLNEAVSPIDVDTIQFFGPSAGKIDLAILAEGYMAEEMDKFIADAKRMTDYLFEAEPFATYRERFNVYAVKSTSYESGTDVAGEGIYRNTAFSSGFYTFGSPRYLSTNDMKSIYDAVDGLAWDQLFVLVNEARYGGGGFYNFLNITSSNHHLSPFVFVHEFGHGFAALADEYYTPSTSVDDFHRLDVEPWEPNITTLIDFERKWKPMVENGVPVPTPRTGEFSNRVGVFEGGGYQEKGIYSPAMSCWMKEAAAGKFCPVCQKAIERVILSNTE